MSAGVVIAVVILNGLLAALVCRLALGLWQWRCAIARLTQTLQTHEIALNLAPKQAGYALAQRRMQIVETRLSLAMWQQRSRQIQQLLQLTLQLTKGLRTLRLIRARKTSFRRSNKHTSK